MSCGIYKIENKMNHHCYIGQSINIESRWIHHRNYSKQNSHYPLYMAFEKYGIEQFDFSIVEECSPQKLNEREIYWISYYDSYNNGYNQTTGGDGSSNAVVKLTSEDVYIIYDLLENSNLSQQEIAKKFDVGEDTISEINQGKTRIDPKRIYPIRQRNKRIYYCQQCGKEISRGATYCIKCNTFLQRKVQRPNRKELKDLIRNNSFRQLGIKYGVSDNSIRKWCIAENLPSSAAIIKSYSDEDWEQI